MTLHTEGALCDSPQRSPHLCRLPGPIPPDSHLRPQYVSLQMNEKNRLRSDLAVSCLLWAPVYRYGLGGKRAYPGLFPVTACRSQAPFGPERRG